MNRFDNKPQLTKGKEQKKMQTQDKQFIQKKIKKTFTLLNKSLKTAPSMYAFLNHFGGQADKDNVAVMDGWMDGWMDGRTDERTNERTKFLVCPWFLIHRFKHHDTVSTH